MPSIDLHQHLWPPGVVQALRRRREPPRLDGDVLEVSEGRFPLDLSGHSPEARLALLDRDGVDVALVSLQPTLGLEAAPEVVDAYHEGLAELVSASGGRLRGFAVGRCLPGFPGASVSAQAVVEGLGELPAELEQEGQALFVHPGACSPPPRGAPPWWAAVVEYTGQMQAAYAAWLADGLERHPGLPVIFALLAGGAPVQLERLRSRGVDADSLLHPSVYLDTASYGRHALGLCLEACGVSQLVYGSDVPVVDPAPTLRALEQLGQAVARTVRIDNPTRILP